MIVSRKAYESAQSRGHRASRKINGKTRSGYKVGKSFFFKSGPTLQKISLTDKTNPCTTTRKRKTPAKKVRAAKRTVKRAAAKPRRKTAVKRYEPGAAYLMKRNPKGYNIYLANAKGTGRKKQGYVLSKGDARRWLKAKGLTKAIIV